MNNNLDQNRTEGSTPRPRSLNTNTPSGNPQQYNAGNPTGQQPLRNPNAAGGGNVPNRFYPQGQPQNRSNMPAQNPYGRQTQNNAAGQGNPNQMNQMNRSGQNRAQTGGAYTPRQRQNGAYNPNAVNRSRPSATGAAYGQNRPYSAGTEAGRRQREAMVNRSSGAPGAPRRERRQKKSFRINWGIVVFLLLCAAIIGVCIWQIVRNGQSEPAASAGTAVQTEDREDGTRTADNGAANALPTAPEAEEEGAEEDNGTSENAEGTGTEPADGSAAVPAGQDSGTENESGLSAPEEEQQGGEEEALNLTVYDTVTLDNYEVSKGDLVLVNATHPYTDGDALAGTSELRNAYSDRTGNLKVGSINIDMKAVAFDALERLAAEMEAETGSHDLLLNSGYRTVAEQQEVWDSYLEQYGEDYTRSYVAVPGCSEHHTGLCCDLTFYTDDGAVYPVSDYAYGWWLEANCAREGFIRRYPDEKTDLTGISGEPWHFRYVGVPHAIVCGVKYWCLEEYIEGVKAYSAEGTMLWVKADGTLTEVTVSDGLPTTDGWLIYYVPKASVGGVTEIRVPRGYDYEISGNNADGFIVTLTLR